MPSTSVPRARSPPPLWGASTHGTAWPRALPEVIQLATGQGPGLKLSDAKVPSAFWVFGCYCFVNQDLFAMKTTISVQKIGMSSMLSACTGAVPYESAMTRQGFLSARDTPKASCSRVLASPGTNSVPENPPEATAAS